MSAYCCNCSSPVGESAKVHPVNVTPHDGVGKTEVWCPRCFAWKRMHLEPERFNALSTAAVRCQFHECGWVTLCTGMHNGVGFCGHCSKPGALPIKPSPEDVAKMSRTMAEVAEEVRAAR
jgi:hypothetical protein